MMRFLAGLILTLGLFTGLSTTQAPAHEVRPAVGDILVTDREVTLDLRVVLEPLIAGINLAEVTDTNDSPLSAQHDTLRAMDPDALRAAFDTAWPGLRDKLILRAGDVDLTPELVTVTVPEVGNTDLPRDSHILLRADLPAGDTAVTFGFDPSLGGLALRHGENGYNAYLTDGALSDPLPRDGSNTQTAGEVFVHYIISGFEHIIPLGLDHILFVLGLFLFSLAWRPLLWQVTTFTLAHTITLALATLGWVSVPGSIVEPLIAASITYVAIENILHKGNQIGWPRIGIVFAFGLLHGLGFASVLGDFGLNEGQFLLSLVAFNIGVELGQLAVIAVAFLAVGIWFGRKPYYRSLIVVPGSIAIAVVGAWWFIERVFL